MKLTCPRCGAIGEIFVIGKDTVAYRCSKCGYISDLALSIPRRTHNVEELKTQALRLRSEGHDIDGIAYLLGTTRQTLYRWARSDEELRHALGVKGPAAKKSSKE